MTSSQVPDAPETIEQEVKILMETIGKERRKYNEYKLIRDVAFECSKPNSNCELDTDLKTKVHNIIVAADLQQKLKLSQNSVVLGVDLTQPDLTYEEKVKLKEIVQQGLVEKHRGIIEGLQNMGISVKEGDMSDLSLSAKEKVLIDLRKQLSDKQGLYIKLLEELIEIFERFIKLKTETVPRATEEKSRECEVQSTLLLLKGEIIDATARAKVFGETVRSVDAHKEILKDILQQQEECKQEIEKLQELKEKYKQVSCKQYDEILKSYLQYKSNIEKKKLLKNKFENK